jgi:hypothetical protein
MTTMTQLMTMTQPMTTQPMTPSLYYLRKNDHGYCRHHALVHVIVDAV